MEQELALGTWPGSERRCGSAAQVTGPSSSPTCYHLHHWDFLVWATCVLESVPRNLVDKPPLSPQPRAHSHQRIDCQHFNASCGAGHRIRSCCPALAGDTLDRHPSGIMHNTAH